MTSGLVLAVDQGTTNTKALVFDRGGQVVASASEPMLVSYPQPGWAEHSALDIWASVQRTIADAASKAACGIEALAISNQRETAVV
jgi:glycerol kinase